MEQRAKDLPSTVIVMYDDEGIREMLGSLLRSAGFRAILRSSVWEFSTRAGQKDRLDARLPGQSGLRTSARARSCPKTATDHLHYRTWRHSSVGAGDKGERDRIFDEAAS